ncbi:MAG TPA: glutamate--tRNA ligase [Acidobacteriota bacterium]|nr:glutamate--tRNA ligase [Acidobacteriota bacterium]HNR40149.1 glutamate--tRNA ligase [Acidobacteriota bacterium]HNU02312.1 glutamate--tRNA ligase [Acidobacteriota bacterium]HPB28882.1 glutamate--tRNA ligase [Acidobacteriota bacterium]HQO26701.1 glutamate--tRNA ligase [Acidobacteriota bacterium]
MSVRVRFAPSPTGNLHVGSARTAIFNWLFARHHGGTFVLRIEDTDQERNRPEYTRSILDGMRWLGLDWDEGPEAGGDHGPYFQSERLPLYREALARLRREGRAYPCFCSPERLETVRQEQLAAKANPRYDGTCRSLSAAEAQARIDAGERYALRIRIEHDEPVTWEDRGKGTITFAPEMLDDLVIAKSDGFPTYNFAVVVDDVGMAITHVIRGEDHISNTPKQILIYRALGAALPEFAHIPMILGADRSKMSKRHGATSVVEYEKAGFLAEAFFNFMTLLGWSPPDDSREIYSQRELVDLFTLERVVAHGAIFDAEKLKWMNLQYIKALSPDDLYRRSVPFLEAIPGFPGPYGPAALRELAGLFRERMNTLAEITRHAEYFFQEPEAYDEKGLKNALKTPDLPAVVEALAARLAAVDPFVHDPIEAAVRAVAEGRGIGAGKVIHPARLALSGRTEGPGLFELMAVLGRECCVARLRAFLDRRPWESIQS